MMRTGSPHLSSVERKRLDALRRYRILDTPFEPEFDRFTTLAARIFQSSISLITLVDEDRQWFKSCYGVDIRETTRDLGFCPYTILSPRVMVVEDTLLDPRFQENPFVIGNPKIRFYAGAPLITQENDIIGTLCILDFQPRKLSAAERATLADLAAMVVNQIQFRLSVALAENSQRNYQCLFQKNPQPVWVYDPETLKFLAVNDKAIEDYGYSQDEFLAMTVAEIRPSQDRDDFIAVVRSRREATTVVTGVWRHLTKDGRLRWVETKADHLEFEGRAARLVVVNDITEEKWAKAQLEASESQFVQFMQSLPCSAFIKDTEHRYLYVNDHARVMFHENDAEYIGKSDHDLFAPEIADQFATSDDEIMQSRLAIQNLAVLPSIDGLRTLLTTKFPIFGADGVPTMIGGVAMDVTEQKQAEEALAIAEKNYRSIFENAMEGIFQISPEGHFLKANPALARLLGYDSPEELLETIQSVSEEIFNDPSQREEYINLVRNQGRVVGFKTRLYRKDRSLIWASVNARVVQNDAGDFLYYEGSVEDITAHMALEEYDQRLLQEALEQADRDPLTSLLNHRAFHAWLERYAKQALQNHSVIGIVVLDLDNFKFFNDAYGHSIGDEVLRHVSAVLSGCAKDDWITARFGGDEFALLIPGANAAEINGEIAKLQECLDEIGFQPPGFETEIPLGLSLGFSIFPDEGATRLESLAAADARLMRTKSGGGNEHAQHLRESLIGTVNGFSMLDALVAAVDNKDRYTRRHSEDVMRYSNNIARELGLDARTIRVVEVAALLHDVGKIGIPDAILRKPGRLMDAEYNAIKHHPMMGSIIVGAIPGFEDTLDAVRHHHERWDGDGYPFGLVGEETPLIARLMAVADAYSAMTTDRPYRKGLLLARAQEILAAGAGIQWDPTCVAAFFRSLNGETIGILD